MKSRHPRKYCPSKLEVLKSDLELTEELLDRCHLCNDVVGQILYMQKKREIVKNIQDLQYSISIKH